MSCKYNEVALGDVCIFGDGAHTKVKRVESGVPYLTSKNIKNGYISIENVDYISEESYEKLFGKSQKSVRHLQEGDVLIGIIGTFGNCYKYKENDKFGISSSIAIVRPDVQKIDSDYLYHYLSSKRFKDYTEIFKGGSVQGYTNLPTLRKIPIYLPNIDIQKRIANILSALDKKIELNNEMNKTLEEMAQTLFKRWFVDFEFPNEDGEPYKSSGGEMAGSELGMIPGEWKVVTLDCFADFKYGKMPKKQFISEQGYPIFSGYKVSGYYNEYMFMEPQLIVVARGVGGTGDVKFTPPMCYLTNLSIAILSNNKSVDEYLYYYLKRGNLRNLDTGSAQSQITINDLKRYKIVMPNLEITIKFHELITSFINQQRQIEKENNDLISLKYSLLPKLMSGEIIVEDIEANL